MTMRSTTQWAARQAGSGISRATIREVDDNHLCQECKTADVGYSETPTQFEIWQPLGVTSVPMDQEQQQQQPQQQGQQGGQDGGQGGGGGAGGGQGAQFNKKQPKGKACEMVMVYANGHRAHPIGMPQDRRCRPYDMDKGEGGFYDPATGTQVLYHRNKNDGADGFYMVTCDVQSSGSGGGQLRIDGRAQQQQSRKLSLRHVQKKPQQRPPPKQQGGQGGTPTPQDGGQGGGGQQRQKYKHEGDSVNTEQTFDKGEIRYNGSGGTVGRFANSNNDWMLHDGSGASNSMRADKNHSHIRNNGGDVWVQGACFKSMPFVVKPDPCSGK